MKKKVAVIGAGPSGLAQLRAFQSARATYAARLEGMARYWATPATSWLGDPMTLRQPMHQSDVN